MCGIAGVAGTGTEPESNRLVGEMVRAMQHRGPDGDGLLSWTFGPSTVCLGHSRLSIIDLSLAGRQPMTERSERYWITFNGEIYNYRELRRILDIEEGGFASASDTEVILRAYARWGEDAFSLLRGMFAFALLDVQAQRITLVRDPLGIKPLYYAIRNGSLWFASEVQALLSTGKVDRSLNRDVVGQYLGQGWSSSCVAAKVETLPPGHMLTVDLSTGNLQCCLSRYAEDVSSVVTPPKLDRNESTAHLSQLLGQSVKCHLVADVPVGLFLSGGIDSTALLYLMRRESGCTPRTFTVVFPEREFSEREHAANIARQFQTDHTEIELSDSDILAFLPDVFAAMDQPTMDGINTYVVSRAVGSAGIKVALSGLGADELFAGYPSFRRASLARLAGRIPRALRAGLASMGRRVTRDVRSEKFWDLLASDCTPQSAYAVSRRLFSAEEVARLMPDHRPAPAVPELPLSDDEIDEVSRLEIRGYMTELLLRDTDFMSMASSLEVRVPFVDKVVMRHVLQLPGSWKLSRHTPKPLLMEAMHGALPDHIWNRPKMGFVLPFQQWMRARLRAEVQDVLSDGRLAKNAGLNPAAVWEVWEGFAGRRLRWSKPWSLYVLLRWLEEKQVAA
jgi:asparagine synthase (glutamine-hydrolysing)